MGWKTLKEHFDIDHSIFVSDNKIVIGNSLRNDLFYIDINTGIIEYPDPSGTFKIIYPEIFNSTPDFLLGLIYNLDTFDQNLPVYTYSDGLILEKKCECYGVGNLTHDGIVMEENKFFKDKQSLIDFINVEFTNKMDRLLVIKNKLLKEIELSEQKISDLKKQIISFNSF